MTGKCRDCAYCIRYLVLGTRFDVWLCYRRCHDVPGAPKNAVECPESRRCDMFMPEFFRQWKNCRTCERFDEVYWASTGICSHSGRRRQTLEGTCTEYRRAK